MLGNFHHELAITVVTLLKTSLPAFLHRIQALLHSHMRQALLRQHRWGETTVAMGTWGWLNKTMHPAVLPTAIQGGGIRAPWQVWAPWLHFNLVPKCNRAT